MPDTLKKKVPALLTLSAIFLLLIPAAAFAQETIPTLTLNLAAGQEEPEQVAKMLEILFLLTILGMAPSILLTMTSFTRIIIVFHFLRQAMGTQQMPPNQILASLAIFMTVVIMMPTGKAINDSALQPYLNEEIGFSEAIDRAQVPIRTFYSNIPERKTSLSLFHNRGKKTGNQRGR